MSTNQPIPSLSIKLARLVVGATILGVGAYWFLGGWKAGWNNIQLTALSIVFSLEVVLLVWLEHRAGEPWATPHKLTVLIMCGLGTLWLVMGTIRDYVVPLLPP